MTTEETKRIIDQLRKDKIIYALEACAVTLLCVLIFLFSGRYFHAATQRIVDIFVLIAGVGYTLFMGIGNFLRLRKIKQLEKQV